MLDTPSPAAPRIVRHVSRAALVAGILITLVGAFRIGVTWDEPLHVQRFNNYSHTGWYLGDGQLVGDEPGPAMKQQFVYAPATMLILNGLGAATGVEHLGTASTSADAYTVRHVGIVGISLLGLLAVMGTGRLLFRRWDWAVVAGASLAVMPMWTGHSMFNLKDVPVATGYALVTYGLAALARSERRAHLLVRAGGPAALAAGTLLAVGTRPGMWTGVFGSIVALVCCLALRPGPRPLAARLRAGLWRLRDLAAALLAAAAGLLVIDPKLFSSPVTALLRAASGSADFIGDPAPRLFVPAHVLMQVPLVMLGLLVVGTVVGARRFLRSRLRLGAADTVLVLVIVQAFFLPMVAVVHGATLYSDLRQLLFSAPASALLVAFGASRLTAAAGRSKDRYASPIAAAVVCTAIAAPLLDQVALFPYDYAYYNPLGAAMGIDGNGDYYRSSGREIAPEMPVAGRIVCSPEIDKGGARRQAHLDGFIDCRNPDSSPLAAHADRISARYPPLAEDEFWALTFFPDGDVPDNCVKQHSISRRTLIRKLFLATLSRCGRPYPTLSSRRVAVTARSLEGLYYLDVGWRSPAVDSIPDGVLARGSAASLTFRLDRRFEGAPVVLTLQVDSPSAVEATFAGTDVEVGSTPRSSVLKVAVPAKLVAEAVEAAQTLTLRSASGHDLDLRLESVRASSSPTR